MGFNNIGNDSSQKSAACKMANTAILAGRALLLDLIRYLICAIYKLAMLMDC